MLYTYNYKQTVYAQLNGKIKTLRQKKRYPLEHPGAPNLMQSGSVDFAFLEFERSSYKEWWPDDLNLERYPLMFETKWKSDDFGKWWPDVDIQLCHGSAGWESTRLLCTCQQARIDLRPIRGLHGYPLCAVAWLSCQRHCSRGTKQGCGSLRGTHPTPVSQLTFLYIPCDKLR